MLAGVFHFPPSELMELDADDLYFWRDRLEEWKEWQPKADPTR